MSECEPLRWVHFTRGPSGAGVYVHLADLLALLDRIAPDDVRRELQDLLDERVPRGIGRGGSA
jgi:hypothetical protein